MAFRPALTQAIPDGKVIAMLKKRHPFFAAVVLCAGAALIGCHGGDPPPAQRAVEVGVGTVKPQPVIITTALPGRTSSHRLAEVRPQLSGVVLQRLVVVCGE